MTTRSPSYNFKRLAPGRYTVTLKDGTLLGEVWREGPGGLGARWQAKSPDGLYLAEGNARETAAYFLRNRYWQLHPERAARFAH